MIKRSVFALCILALLLTACAPAVSRQASPAQPAPAIKGAPSSGLPYNSPSDSGSGVSSSGAAIPAMAVQPQAPALETSGSAASIPDRLVIQNAEMTIVVDEPPNAMNDVARMAKELGGFVVTSNVYKTRTQAGLEVPQANITIRVPADKLDDALARIRGLTKNPKEDVRAENRSGQDVTKEYVDLQSRLANLQDTEKQLREIMASATKTEDVMSVFNQLTQVREQIEVTQGQIKYFEESAALSAVSLQILASASVAPLTVGGWQPAGVARDAIQSLIDALKFLANALIWIILYVLPIGLIIGIPVWLVIALFRRMRRARKVASNPPPAQ